MNKLPPYQAMKGPGRTTDDADPQGEDGERSEFETVMAA